MQNSHSLLMSTSYLCPNALQCIRFYPLLASQSGALISITKRCCQKRCLQIFPYPSHPSIPIRPLIAFEHLSLYIQNYKIKIGAIRILRSENTLGQWETVVDCMEMSAMINFTKELPQNTTVVQSEHTQLYSKVPMTAPSRGSL